MTKIKIGVLALQGAFQKHIEMLKSISIDAYEVRKPADLIGCAGVIIPGGESTTILKQLWFVELFHALAKFAVDKPLFGTCAGLILMSKEIESNKEMQPFGLLDVVVERNAFGRQVESFRTKVDLTFSGSKPIKYPAVFIRAPRIRSCGPEVKILATYEGEPILIKEGIHLGATFHPELTDDPLIHEFFVAMVKGVQSAKSP